MSSITIQNITKTTRELTEAAIVSGCLLLMKQFELGIPMVYRACDWPVVTAFYCTVDTA